MKIKGLLATRLGIAALLASVAATALAQDQGGPGGPPPGGMQGGPGGGRPGGGPRADRFPPLGRLVAQPAVATELGLTDDQIQKIQAIVEASRPQGGPGGQGGPDGQGGPPDQGGQGSQGGGPRRGQGQNGGMNRERAEDAADAKILATLSNTQIRRLYQIQIQAMGLTAALVPAVQDKLNLTDAQKIKLKALVPARRQGGPGQGGPGGGGQGGPPGGDMGGQGGPPPDMQGGPGGQGGFGGPGQGGPGGGGPGGGMQGQRKAMETKIAAILTADQKATLKSLGGKAIKLQEDRGPGGMGGPGQGGPGGPPPDGL